MYSALEPNSSYIKQNSLSKNFAINMYLHYCICASTAEYVFLNNRKHTYRFDVYILYALLENSASLLFYSSSSLSVRLLTKHSVFLYMKHLHWAKAMSFSAALYREWAHPYSTRLNTIGHCKEMVLFNQLSVFPRRKVFHHSASFWCNVSFPHVRELRLHLVKTFSLITDHGWTLILLQLSGAGVSNPAPGWPLSCRV